MTAFALTAFDKAPAVIEVATPAHATGAAQVHARAASIIASPADESIC